MWEMKFRFKKRSDAEQFYGYVTAEIGFEPEEIILNIPSFTVTVISPLVDAFAPLARIATMKMTPVVIKLINREVMTNSG